MITYLNLESSSLLNLLPIDPQFLLSLVYLAELKCFVIILQATISGEDFAVSQCFLPREMMVITLYITGGLICILSLLIPNKSLVRFNESYAKFH